MPEPPVHSRPTVAASPSDRETVDLRPRGRRARRILPAGLLALGAGLAVAACGSSSSAPAKTHATASASPTSVASVTTNVTAQMVRASSQASSRSHEAVFTLTATERDGHPAADQPVNFWIGPMFPRCDDPIKAWYEVGGAKARRFVASSSTRTNASGHATLTLFGQPAKTMEMVAVRVGGLSSFGDGHGNGLLDAWWTSPGANPTAPIGDRVTVAPFLTAGTATQTAYHVHVTDDGGHAVQSARVSLRANVMTGTPHSTTVLHSTDASGSTSFDYPRGSLGTLRVKVYRPASSALFSGSVTAESVTAG